MKNQTQKQPCQGMQAKLSQARDTIRARRNLNPSTVLSESKILLGLMSAQIYSESKNNTGDNQLSLLPLKEAISHSSHLSNLEQKPIYISSDRTLNDHLPERATSVQDEHNGKVKEDHLQFVEDLDRLDSEELHANEGTYTYEREGDKETLCLINHSNLRHKYLKIKDLIAPPDNSTIQKVPRQTFYTKERGPEQPQQYLNTRYYHSKYEQTDTRRFCIFCGNLGHPHYRCNQQSDKCNYCMGNHHFKECEQFTCDVCLRLGHKPFQCMTMGVECEKCHRKGHGRDECGRIPRHWDAYKPSNLDKRLAKCLLCGKNGHFNCSRQKPDDVYSWGTGNSQRRFQPDSPQRGKNEGRDNRASNNRRIYAKVDNIWMMMNST